MRLSSFLFRPSPAAAGPQTAIGPTSISQPRAILLSRPLLDPLLFLFIALLRWHCYSCCVCRQPTLPSKQNHYLKSSAVIRLLELYLNFSQILSNTPFCVQVKQLSLSFRENRRKGKVWNLKVGKL